MHLSFPPLLPLTPPISPSFILSRMSYFEKSVNHDGTQYAILSSRYLTLSLLTLFSSLPHSRHILSTVIAIPIIFVVRINNRTSMFLVSYCLTVLLSYYLTVLLSYSLTVLLYYCLTVLLSYCITVLLYYCIAILLSYCLTLFCRGLNFVSDAAKYSLKPDNLCQMKTHYFFKFGISLSCLD
jgi:hypothetical protein